MPLKSLHFYSEFFARRVEIDDVLLTILAQEKFALSFPSLNIVGRFIGRGHTLHDLLKSFQGAPPCSMHLV